MVFKWFLCISQQILGIRINSEKILRRSTILIVSQTDLQQNEITHRVLNADE